MDYYVEIEKAASCGFNKNTSKTLTHFVNTGVPTLTTDIPPQIAPDKYISNTYSSHTHVTNPTNPNMITLAIPNSPSSAVSSSVYSNSSPETCSVTHSPSTAFKFHLQNQPPPATGFVKDTPKRKRPAMLTIQVAPFRFSDGLMPPEKATEDQWKEVVVEGDGYSVYCKKGNRKVMEDRFRAVVEFNGQHKQVFFGVFDGHGGSKAAEFAAENLDKNILTELEKNGETNIIEAVKQGYMSTDSQFLTQNHSGGACCVTAIIRDNNLVVSNAGDCRAVVSISGTATPLTSDHRPSRQDEKLRIESLGGYVDCSHGVPRVLGSLGVSRSIGDRSLKQWITAEPESEIIEIVSEIEFLIMASDGLWDKVSNQEAIDLARPYCVGNNKLEPVLACKKLVELAVSRGSKDDATVMIVNLGRFC